MPVAAHGRLLEIKNGRLVEAKHENSIAERRAALEKPEGRVWVVHGRWFLEIQRRLTDSSGQ